MSRLSTKKRSTKDQHASGKCLDGPARSTGIQVQQTSATSNTQTVRIQGLDGRYTQILKDGFPAYGGFSGSLSLLEIPPLDLKQVEVIKGPSATLFGGDAIAGVVNFVTKDPGRVRSTN
ncbi:MAG: TonB-dependent receptor plug domain-containing protein [Acidobacteria bacterium]|nr:TonB-dependent receptor plug domain-containing protein [Acidobacteriota bacterium]